MTTMLEWHQEVYRQSNSPPTGGVPVGLAIKDHWFTAIKDNAGTMCDTCFGFCNDPRHKYEGE